MAKLSDLEQIIKYQGQDNVTLTIVEEFGGTYLKANDLLVQLSEYHFGSEYIVNSQLKQLFFRKRKTNEVGFDGVDLLYDGKPLSADLTKTSDTYEADSLHLIEFYTGSLASLKMQVKEDITNWSNSLFLVVQDGTAYFGMTNLSDFTALQTQLSPDTPNNYLLLDYKPIMSELAQVSELHIVFDDSYEKVIIFSGVYGYQTTYQPMTAQQIKQFNILLAESGI